MSYVYALLDSSKPGLYKYGSYIFEYEPFYIGKGTGNRIKETLHDKSIFKKNKIDKLNKNGIKIISIIILDLLTNEESVQKEIELISLIGRRDLGLGTLVNTTDGGDGRLNSKQSEETKKLISKNRTGKRIGWKHSGYRRGHINGSRNQRNQYLCTIYLCYLLKNLTQLNLLLLKQI
jgi:hypothetical protein